MRLATVIQQQYENRLISYILGVCHFKTINSDYTLGIAWMS